MPQYKSQFFSCNLANRPTLTLTHTLQHFRTKKYAPLWSCIYIRNAIISVSSLSLWVCLFNFGAFYKRLRCSSKNIIIEFACKTNLEKKNTVSYTECSIESGSLWFGSDQPMQYKTRMHTLTNSMINEATAHSLYQQCIMISKKKKNYVCKSAMPLCVIDGCIFCNYL